MSVEELEQRLQWIGTEIKQLSTASGVAARLQALRYSQAQLLATKHIRRLMGDSSPDDGQQQ